jgi:hypothetical protein
MSVRGRMRREHRRVGANIMSGGEGTAICSEDSVLAPMTMTV